MREFVNNENKQLNIGLRTILHIPIIVNYIIQTNYSGDSVFIQEFKNVAKSYWKRGDTSKVDNSAFVKRFTEIYEDRCISNQDYYKVFINTFMDADPSLKDWFTGRVYIERNWPDGRDADTQAFIICEMDENDEPVPTDMKAMLSNRFGWKQFKFFKDPLSEEIFDHNANHRSSIIKFPKVLVFSFVTGHNKLISKEIIFDDLTYTVMCAATKDDIMYRVKDQWYKNLEKLPEYYQHEDNYTFVVYTPTRGALS